MATEAQYVILLRGINVGGKNIVKMAELRTACEAIGLADVATYINSGNVLFRAPRRRRAEMAAEFETELTERLGTELKVVVLSEPELRAVVEGAPDGFGAETHRCDVIFLRKPLTVNKAIGLVETREGVDQAWAGKGVLYFSRLAAKASGSRLSRIVALPEYQNMTIRNWRTTTKLLALMEERAS
ncbi:MAG TPA: DUF1697 domain-containing protein [Solirubrobacterales bacterium]|nr:DUF1697 domain-containing protein [Solirubrobacterales bacterium]